MHGMQLTYVTSRVGCLLERVRSVFPLISMEEVNTYDRPPLPFCNRFLGCLGVVLKSWNRPFLWRVSEARGRNGCRDRACQKDRKSVRVRARIDSGGDCRSMRGDFGLVGYHGEFLLHSTV